jgi:hypothetical protein
MPSSKIVLPGLHGAEPTMICRVPTGPEDICGKPFYPGEELAWQRHVGECARAHMDAIKERSPASRNAWAEDWDPEYSAFMEKVGRRMLAEGRWETKPNER